MSTSVSMVIKSVAAFIIELVNKTQRKGTNYFYG